ncbi:MAG: Flp pilus assembly protein CpaB [Alphaproteobacteria bacterium]|nr:Flp pilus assembly protein CpaB [Alphaproteobacteria bacterium]
MRPLTIILLVVALAVAGLTAFLAKRYLNQQSAASSQEAARRAATNKQILVAAVDLPIGRIIKETDIRWQDWPESMLNSKFVIRSGGEDARTRYIGSVVRSAFITGEPILPSRVFRGEGTGTMAGLLAPGMRAVSVELSLAKEVSGFVFPGDRVDILVTYELKGGSAENVYKFVSETILRDVRVVALDQTFTAPKETKDGKGGSIKAKTVTLEVTDKQAETVAVAGTLGSFSLSLRSFARGEGESEEPSYSTDMMVSQGLRDTLGSAKAKGEQPAPEAASEPTPSSSGAVVKVYRGASVATQSFNK